MESHGIARTARKPRTEAQIQSDLAKIETLRSVEAALLRAARPSADTDTDTPDLDPAATLALTTKLLRLNPEHYTAWNVRRRCLTCGSLSKPSPGPSPSAPPASSSAACTPPPSSAAALPSSSAATRPAQPSPAGPGSGRSGTTVEHASSIEDRVRDAAEGDKPAGEQKDGKAHATDEVVATLKNELNFTIPLLLEFPKSYWIWKYRSWLLQQAVDLLPRPLARRVWQEELGLVSKMLSKDRRNFHAWGYRRKVVAVLESAALGGESLVESEFAYTTSMIKMDLSNFSAWHSRSNLMSRLLEERGADDAVRQKFLEDELELVREALNVGPEDQSLWFYHRFLVQDMTEADGRSKIAPNLSRDKRARYVRCEIDGIKELLEDYDDIVWIYKALLDYTIALPKLEGRAPDNGEVTDLGAWMAEVRRLDPMRNGRWDDLEKECGLL
ncbi:geranylgeranyl transferase type-2 subunit alpha [Colletotrichum higginsianum]|uniref:Geranylgeranyl transferase type-2 subunit alpha n=1 Tax=Colletotrichum higginsianum (strain IMI 349063) TaxID=759273 RepID=H1VR18_COLHI|nr:Geranylgeranyl transferase type-2 subunit alpha [Colletotrichum higginsianum IMI 349063]OBR03500.1 Geranylgeranyl transferase type-2 subunit alpha [Colletotrichum higginsianum IMI 349063]CCF42674.1 geranylgeranyl transferase type-2 subunit alpha [Colletotrichum higginsianum]